MTNKRVDFYRLGSELWSIANIFRDDTLKTTEYLEEFSYFLFLKMFDDKEMQNEEVAELDGKNYIPYLPEDLRFYNWAGKIVDNEIPASEIVPTVKNIFQQLSNIRDHDEKDLSLFRRLFRNHIWRIRYIPTVRELLKRLMDLELEHNFDVMGRAYEFIVQKLGEQKQYGQYFTPRHIIHFMIELADPEIEETIYDPAAGTGGFILRSFEVIKCKIEKLTETSFMGLRESTVSYGGVEFDRAEKLLRDLKGKNLFAVEKAPDVYKLALMNMILHNDGNTNLYEADSLDNRAQVEHREKYDVVLTNPPYGPLTQSRVGTFDYHVKRFEALFIQHVMNALKFSHVDKKPSRAAIIILDKVLFDNTKAFKNIRKKLLREYNLKAVFSMPAGIFQPYSGAKTTILYFEKPTKEQWGEVKQNQGYMTKNVLFFDVKGDGFTLTTQRRPINGAFQGDEPDIYDPPCGDLPKAVEVFGKWVKWLETPTKDLPDFVDNEQVWVADIEEIKEKDFNLNPGLYRKVERGKIKWGIVPLKDVLVSLETGKRPKGGVLGITSGIPSIGGEHIDDSGGLKLDNLKFISDDFFNELSKGIIREETILIVKDGATTGKVAIAKNMPFDKAAVNEHVFLLRPDKDVILSDFLFCILFSEFGQTQLRTNKKGAAQGGISRDFVNNVFIPLPPLEIQRQIVKRLNRQQAIIEKAKEMEKAILEAGIDDAIFEGDWEWVELEEICNLSTGTTPPTDNSEYYAGTIPFIKTSEINNNIIESAKTFISNKAVKECNLKVHPKGTVFLAMYGQGLTRGRASLLSISATTSQNAVAIEPNTGIISSKFLWYFFLRLYNDLRKSAYGGSMPHLSLKIMKQIKIPILPLEKQKEIVACLDVQFETLEKIRKSKKNAEGMLKLILEKEVFRDG